MGIYRLHATTPSTRFLLAKTKALSIELACPNTQELCKGLEDA